LNQFYDSATREAQKERQEFRQRQQELQKQRESANRVNQLEVLRNRYFALIGSDNPNQRGIEFERLLHDIFKFEQLNPEGSFSLPGEQTDGAIELDGTHYLVEAKWTKPKVGPKDVSWFQTKVERRYKATTGLMIAINGFTDQAIRTAGDSKCIVLMDGDDLYHVLQPTIDMDLKELLLKKVAAFSRKGTPFVTARELLAEKN